jgi:hypothetical protein
MILASTLTMMLRQGWRDPAAGSTLTDAITGGFATALVGSPITFLFSRLPVAAAQMPHRLPLCEFRHRLAIRVAIQSP